MKMAMNTPEKKFIHMYNKVNLPCRLYIKTAIMPAQFLLAESVFIFFLLQNEYDFTL